ncbi:MAG: CBS domain-containing protein [Deltaproteobacteria bacterium]|nr:CBS domain-containing protein [Deltaproteobacteria bacterium]
MLVKDWMSKNVVTVDVNDTMQRAINLMMDHRISMAPVMDQGKLVGILTDRDLRRAAPSDVAVMDVRQILYHITRLTCEAIMSRNPITVPFDFTMEEAAETLLRNNISGAPVLDKTGAIVGIITKNDMFKAFIALTGLRKRGVQFGFLLEDRPGSIKEVTDIIRKHRARLVSILSSYENAPEGFRHVYVRAFHIDRNSLPVLEQELKEKAKLLYMVDHREDNRVIYQE